MTEKMPRVLQRIAELEAEQVALKAALRALQSQYDELEADRQRWHKRAMDAEGADDNLAMAESYIGELKHRAIPDLEAEVQRREGEVRHWKALLTRRTTTLREERIWLIHTLKWIRARNRNGIMVPGYDSILGRVIDEALAGQMPKGIGIELREADV